MTSVCSYSGVGKWMEAMRRSPENWFCCDLWDCVWFKMVLLKLSFCLLLLFFIMEWAFPFFVCFYLLQLPAQMGSLLGSSLALQYLDCVQEESTLLRLNFWLGCALHEGNPGCLLDLHVFVWYPRQISDIFPHQKSFFLSLCFSSEFLFCSQTSEEALQFLNNLLSVQHFLQVRLCTSHIFMISHVYPTFNNQLLGLWKLL